MFAFYGRSCPLLEHERTKGHGRLEAPQSFLGRATHRQGTEVGSACNKGENCGCHRCAPQWNGRILFYQYYTDTLTELWAFEADVLKHIDRSLPPQYRSCGRLYVGIWGGVDIRFQINGQDIWVYRFFVILPSDMVWSRLWEKPFGADGICLEPNQAGDGVRNHMDVHALPSGSSLERTRKFLQFGLDLIRSSSNDSGAKGHIKSFSFGNQRRFEEMCRTYLGLNVWEIWREDPPPYEH
ncbi:hypothetical protein EDB81DRAFT_807513 [Dactylonectria macrodidyma]|uniref:Uncharacterized protein n=1 Tax=Dactylonectria macrodidyma TaxID=307937 RepID=A0A9P9E9B8_9HYPO|nr:hypothetical protein EDB81DRAFT_807513 [Dactylonectria macrodidyma]